MKIFWLGIIIACCCVLGFAQDNKIKAGFVLFQAKLKTCKNINSVDRIFVETSSKYTMRKAKLKPGIIPSSEYTTKLWIQKPDGIKMKTLTNYPGNSAQLTEKTLSKQAIRTSIKVKGPNDNGFTEFFFARAGRCQTK